MADTIDNQALNQSGEETTSIDTPSVDEKAIEQAFEAGFDDFDSDDGPIESESDPKSEVSEDNKTEDDLNGSTDDNKSERPDKRTRRSAESRISTLIAEKKRTDAENEQLRALLAQQQDQSFVPQPDDEGNYSADDMLEYQRHLAENAAKSESDKLRQQLLEVERQKECDQAISDVNSYVQDSMSKYDSLNPNSDAFDEKVSSHVRDRVIEAVYPYISSGNVNYKEVTGIVKDTIQDTMELIKSVSASASKNTARNLDDLRYSSALISKEGGIASHDDPMLDGFGETGY